ncbi:MAG: tRNA (adenosine(37)-N6)-dimethylallyltransferase MiaA [Muribaculaceae bacterium]|nr:tRNA (adenosine(37)-N6)-dimethylallyltransferase MiaA [Muribaculaceae bacterium]
MLVITGPTASGKTALAVAAARRLGGEIVSADSRQVYTGMDIGTGKDREEYGEVPVHMLDVVPAGYKYNLYEYLRDANECIDNIRSRGTLPVICGGTGLYVEALLNGLRLPEVPVNHELRASLEGKNLDELAEILAGMKSLHNRTDIDTVKRAVRAIEIADYYNEHPDEAVNVTPHPVKDAVIVCVDIPRDERRQRITRRLHARLEQGMIDEVRKLLENGLSPEDLIYYGLEYKFITEYLTGVRDYDSLVKDLETAIHQFAKRQMTWFRGMERRGFTLNYIPYNVGAEEFCDRVAALTGL